MRRLLITLVLLFQISNVYAGVCDTVREMTTEQERVIDNICHFQNTVLVEIKSDYLVDWYNPVTHFRVPNTYKYDVKVIEVFKGKDPNTACMLESTEDTFVISAGISNTQQIVSFDKFGDCVLIDVGAIQKATPELIKVARETINSIKRESKHAPTFKRDGLKPAP